MAFATAAAARLFGSYPNARAHDPEIFTAQVVWLLLRYDRTVVSYIVDNPPATEKWDGLPSYDTLRRSLDDRAFRIAADRASEDRIARQLSDREADERRRTEQLATGEHDRVVTGLASLNKELTARLVDLDGGNENRKARRMAFLERANRCFFERECAAAGINPAGGVSPSLRKQLQTETIGG